jgi:hypothetical protein
VVAAGEGAAGDADGESPTDAVGAAVWTVAEVWTVKV